MLEEEKIPTLPQLLELIKKEKVEENKWFCFKIDEESKNLCWIPHSELKIMSEI